MSDDGNGAPSKSAPVGLVYIDSVRPKRIFLTIDAEFWDSPQFFGLSKEKNREHGNSGCWAVLELFDRLGVRATFFVAAEFARAHPETVVQMLKGGHEIASHSYSHVRLNKLAPQERRIEVVRSKAYLEEQFGVSVAGFRAPGNLMSRDHFEMLRQTGYRYDSSLHPALLPHQPLNVFRPRYPFAREGVVEIPVTTLAGLPVSWIWMRNTGPWLPKAAVYYNRILGRDAVLYLHSWEFEPLPELPNLPRWIVRRTGKEFLEMLEVFVCHFQRKGFIFDQLHRLADEYLNHHSRL